MNRKHSVDAYLRLAARVFESSHEGIVVTNQKGEIELVNPAFTKITGFTKEEVLGRNPRMFKSGLHDEPFYCKLWNDLKEKGEWSGEIWNRRKNGELYTQWMTLSTLRDEKGQVTGYASIFTDITEKKQAEQKFNDDLELAKRVQKSVLSEPIDYVDIKIRGVNIASEELAGDMYTWYKISDHQYGVILIDVMGHGVASSLICMSVRSLLRGLIKRVIDPAQVSRELNGHMKNLFSEHKGRMPYYFSMIYLVIDTLKKEINYVNAGHPPAILIQDGEASLLEATTTPVGFISTISVENTVIYYSNSAHLLLYTDGLLENNHSSLGESIEHLTNYFLEMQHLDNEKIITSLLNYYVSGKPQDDDISIVSIKVK